MSDDEKKIDVAVGVLTRRSDNLWQVLIARRPVDAVLGGCWEFPGGKVEPGESLCQCVTREFQEEVGLTVHAVKALSVIEHPYPHGTVRLHPFLCRLDTANRPDAASSLTAAPSVQNLAVDETRWVTVNELVQYQFPPANDPLIAQLVLHLDETPVSG